MTPYLHLYPTGPGMTIRTRLFDIEVYFELNNTNNFSAPMLAFTSHVAVLSDSIALSRLEAAIDRYSLIMRSIPIFNTQNLAGTQESTIGPNSLQMLQRSSRLSCTRTQHTK